MTVGPTKPTEPITPSKPAPTNPIRTGVWFCTHGTQKLFVRAERWHDAREWAKRVFNTDEAECVATQQEPEVELRWAGGSDFNHGGEPNAVHLQVREIGDDGWGDWRRA